MERKSAVRIILTVTGLMIASVLMFSHLANAGDNPISAVARKSFERTIESLETSEARFRQERKIASLSRPLVSSGSIKLDRDGTLFWEQEQPFAVLIKMMPDAIEETVADGPPRRITREQNPYLVAFSQAFVGLFAGNPQAMETLFTLESSETGSGWEIKLVPKDKNIKRMISMIRISGDKRLNQIQIMESGANQTNIYLTYQMR